MKNKKLEVLTKIIFFGAVWGIVEATLGYALHFLPGYLAGSLMFPFVMFILVKAYRSLGNKRAIFYVALVAVAIKSINLLMPFMPAAKTINPMVAMILEALLVFAVIPLFESDKVSEKISAFVIASIGWRVLYIGYQGLNYLFTDYLSAYLQDLSLTMEFVLGYGLASIAFMTVIYFGFKNLKFIKKIDVLKINPIVSLASLLIAILVTIFI